MNLFLRKTCQQSARRSACLLLALGLSATTGLGAGTWWETKLEESETYNKQVEKAHEAVCAANPGWKEFKPLVVALVGSEKLAKPLAVPLVGSDMPVPVRVNMSGIRKVWIGSLNRGTIYCGNPVWVDANGNKTPVTGAQPSVILMGPRSDPLGAPYMGDSTTNDVDMAIKNNAISFHADDGKPWKPFNVRSKEYSFGIVFDNSQALFEVPAGTEWFETEVAISGASNSFGHFVVDLESKRALVASCKEAEGKIDEEIERKFNTHQDMCEQFLERAKGFWSAGEGIRIPFDVPTMIKRYSAASPPDLSQKLPKINSSSPSENLAHVRSLFYLDQARQRIDLCRKTADLVTRDGGDVSWAKGEIDALEAKVSSSLEASTQDGSALFGEVFRLRRKILFAHPSLQFQTLLINKNPPTRFNHDCDQYLGRHSRIGEGPTLLTGWQGEHPQERVLLKDRMPPGAFSRPHLSPDGTKFVFAYADHSPNNRKFIRYFLYEAAIDGSWVRQLTGTPRDLLKTRDDRQTVMIEDADPCYLPDGGIVFVSTRAQDFGRCHGGRYAPGLELYRCDKDGNDIRILSYGIENENTPSVLNDGRIIYTRWEYVDRHQIFFHKLWTTRPDGTGVAGYYGYDTIYPLMIAESHAIPGSQKIVATAQAHHSFTTGTLIVIDVQKGENGPEPVTRLTPEVKYPESNESDGKPGQFSSPFPLNENLYFASYSPGYIWQGYSMPSTGRCIMLVDTLGGREPIYRDPDSSSFSPTPVVPQKQAPILPSMLPETQESNTGIYAVQNVNLTRNDPEGLLKPGQIKALRFNQLYVKPAASNAPLNSVVSVGLAKRILGTVPVADDGSVVVRVPAGVPLQIQALDKNGMAVMTERSFHYLHAGEYRGCVGCHADSKGAPPTVKGTMMMSKPMELIPPAGPDYPGGFSFQKTVQPVLDHYCISCHGLGEKEPEKGGNLVAEKNGTFSKSYLALVGYTNPIGHILFTTGIEKNISRPMDYYAHGSRLGKMLLAGHQNVSLPREDFQRIINWLDLNSVAYGDSSFNRIESANVDREKEKALREAVKSRFGESFAKQPYHALVNPANPDESRLLMAPLATKAGGWEQIPNGWASKQDPDYKRFHDMVVATIVPVGQDISGTCGHDEQHCSCGGCWVRENKLNIPPLTATPIK
ncbi:MAG: hypothetical protein WCQ16_01225 [Verrucomicrobiae bacterium]